MLIPIHVLCFSDSIFFCGIVGVFIFDHAQVSHPWTCGSGARVTIKLLVGIDWFDYWAFVLYHQPFDYQSDRELKCQYQWFDYQVIWHNHSIISDSAMWLETFTKRLRTIHKSNKPEKNTDSAHMTTTSSVPFVLLPTVGYFRFLYAPTSAVKTPLSPSQVWYWFLPSICFPVPCPWSFAWEPHAVFQIGRVLISGDKIRIQTLCMLHAER